MMKGALITLVICSTLTVLAHDIGYGRAESYYLARIYQTDRAIREALHGSAQTLAELSALTGVSDARDLEILQEIINATSASDNVCRIDLERVRALDAIVAPARR
jgi:bacterioferritin-associated ferredoxin